MRMFICTVGLLAALCAGCARPPLTEWEFRGFCYTLPEGREATCDNINMCDNFDSNAVGMPHKSRAECVAACQSVYNSLYDEKLFTNCSGTLRNAEDWCLKYCLMNFPQ